MLEYAPMPHVLYYGQNYAGIIRQGLQKRVQDSFVVQNRDRTQYSIDFVM